MINKLFIFIVIIHNYCINRKRIEEDKKYGLQKEGKRRTEKKRTKESKKWRVTQI